MGERPDVPASPEYKVYRSRRGPLARRRRPDALRERRSREPRRREPREPARAARDHPGRVLKWVALAIAGWLLLSLVLFLISAQTQDGVSRRGRGGAVERRQPPDGQHDPRARLRRADRGLDRRVPAGPGRADSIMLLHVGLGSVRKLSILRDSLAEIPGHGSEDQRRLRVRRPALMIETVEGFLGNGLEINHLVEVDFENFPELIDALGGIDVDNKSAIRSPPFDNFWKGLRFGKGELTWTGGGARLRAGAQERLRPGRGRPRPRRAPAAGPDARSDAVISPARSSGSAGELGGPQTIRSDMKGPAARAVHRPRDRRADDDRVLEASCCRGGALAIPDEEKADGCGSSGRRLVARRPTAPVPRGAQSDDLEALRARSSAWASTRSRTSRSRLVAAVRGGRLDDSPAAPFFLP